MTVLIQQYMDQEQLHSVEGRRGVVTLAKVCRAIGYTDRNYSGQLESGASIGDITTFLEDNSGAIEAVINWIAKQRNQEWKESVEALLVTDGDDDDDDDDDDRDDVGGGERPQ